jgi:chorismate mutase
MKRKKEEDSEKKHMIRAIRGAIDVEKNERDFILKASKHLMENIASENHIKPENILSIIFTSTQDINAEFPASVLRGEDWRHIPALCTSEMDVPGGMKSVIRVLVHAYLSRDQKDVKHQYLGKTIQLRPDLKGEDNDHRDEI